ncbi:MAG: Flp pilus assembly complex ATPase component TadA [Deltaproteobacteria bacterium]|nr:Flp pilus assembly complex ATPase component TadA [Deltaproteobacteria bacterium]
MTRVVCVMGAKDGVGCTTLAVNLGIVWSEDPTERVLLIDADRDHAGDVASQLGVAQLRSWTAARDAWTRWRGAALEGFLAVPSRPLSAVACDTALPTAALTTQLSSAMAALRAQYSTVVLDAGSRLTPDIAAWWPWVTHWACVVTPDPGALHAAVRLLAAWQRAFIAAPHRLVCGNRWGDQAPISVVTAAERLGHPLVFALPDEPLAAAATAEGLPLAMRRPSPGWVYALREGCDRWVAVAPLAPDVVRPEQLFPQLRTERTATPVSTEAAPPSLDGLKDRLLDQFFSEADAATLPAAATPCMSTPNEDPRRIAAEAVMVRVLDAHAAALPATVDRTQLLIELLDEALLLGPLEVLLADPDVTEVMVNGPNEVYVERQGRLTRTAVHFRHRGQLQRVIERIVSGAGRRVDESSPIVDARLSDGARVNIVLAPLALNGPILTIRRFGTTAWTLARLQERGAVTAQRAEQLAALVRARKNILVVGGTGSGKTTLLNALSGCISATERIITIEDAAELQLQQPHVVRLEARPANLEGAGAITIRDLVRTALRMRPDRIIVGECRGGEALDMLQAMNTGHDGSLTTLHANSPREAIARLATLVCFAGVDLPLRAIYEQVVGALDVVVQVVRRATGERAVADVMAVVGLAGDTVELQEVADAPTA